MMTAIHDYIPRHPTSFQVKMESDTNADREERKREYNRLAQREFRRRRKEHLKNLEQLQKEQTSEQSTEIDRLRLQNAELKRENEQLKAQVYGSSIASHQYQMPSTLPSSSHSSQIRSYSVSPSLSSTLDSMSTTGSPSSAIHQDLLHPMPMGLTSSMISSSMQAYADMPITTLPSQPFPMVNSSGVRHNSQSSQESSVPATSRPSVGSSFQSLTIDDSNAHVSQRTASTVSTSSRPSLIALVPYDREKARNEVLQMFAPLVTSPSALSNPSTHLSILATMAPSLPTTLKPTRNQLTIPHYWGIDLLSSPALRDRLISVGPELSEQFVTEIASCKGPDEDWNQLIIWGEDPNNEMSWEFSGAVLSRWGWLLGRDWVERSNFWRRQRGAQALPDW